MTDSVGPVGGGPGDSDDRIIQTDLRNEMSRSYLEYAMSVIVGRALPDARDGLKPVHRRILVRDVRAGPHQRQALPQVRPCGGRSASANITPMATPPCTTPWCGWPRTSPCRCP